MKRRVLIALMVVAAAAGCSKSDILEPNTYLPGGNAIAFSDMPTTRGAIESSATLDEMDIYAYYTAGNTWANANGAVSKFMNHQLITKSTSGVWSYSPMKYWSNNDGDMFSFFAFSPYGAISVTHNANDKPVFNYTLQPSASDNDDLLAAVQYNKQKSIDAVNLPFKHALTRISLKGSLSGAAPTNVSYMVESVEFHGIRRRGKLMFRTDNTVYWILVGDATDIITCTATQGQTLLSHNSTTEIAELTTAPKDLCKDGKAIFILPQNVENAYINLNIIKKTSTGSSNQEEIITIENIAMPTTELGVGQWITMNFTYEVGSKTGNTISDGGDDPTLKDHNNDKKVNYNDVVQAMIDIAQSGEDTIVFDFEFKSDYLFDGGDDGEDSVFVMFADYIDSHRDEFPEDYTFSIDLNISGDYDDIKDMQSNIFANNPYIKSVILPPGIKKLSQDSFENCTNLESVVVGSPTEPSGEFDSIEEAFSGCTNLKSVIIYTETNKSKAEDILSGDVFNNTPLEDVNGTKTTLTGVNGYKYSWIAP